VLVTVSDKKIAVDGNTDGTIDYYSADILTVADYAPFGMQLVGRKWNGANYRYGLNGQEKSTEIDANGNSMTAEFWQYDARIARRWNIDPVFKEYESPYSSFGNNPIWFSDYNGADTTAPMAGGGTVSLPTFDFQMTFYPNSQFTLKGTNISVPVEKGQVRSFWYWNLGEFTARWTSNNGTAKFLGYLNEENLDFNQALDKYNSEVRVKEFLTKVDNFFSNPINQALLIAAPLEIQRASFRTGSLRTGNPSIVVKTEFEVAAKTEIKAALTSQNTTRALAPYWPPNGGALGEWYNVSAIKGAKFDRIGGLGGNYLAPLGTPFEMRALPANGTYRAFEVLKPFPMQVSTTAPWFGKPGLGTQYKTPISIEDLLGLKYLKPL
jgi:hypothetical protein